LWGSGLDLNFPLYHLRGYGDAIAGVHVEREKKSHHMAILNQEAVAISRTGKIFQAALRIFQHSYLLVIRIF
jgi:hypothetical protein